MYLLSQLLAEIEQCLSWFTIVWLKIDKFHFLTNIFSMQLLESFEKSFPKLKFPPLPERGDFDMKEVLESPYFFN